MRYTGEIEVPSGEGEATWVQAYTVEAGNLEEAQADFERAAQALRDRVRVRRVGPAAPAATVRQGAAEYLHLLERLRQKVRQRQAKGDLLTFREAGLILARSYDEIQEMAEDADLCINVGIQAGGLGGGIGLHASQGDYTLEDLTA